MRVKANAIVKEFLKNYFKNYSLKLSAAFV
jgi:hypothetical protein